MHKFLTVTAALFLFLGLHNSFSQKLSSSAQISLITASPGNELYSIFGHSAIRVKDDSLGIDRVYNYGTFDFDTPNFYLKFMRGKLNYYLSVAPFDRFYYTYAYDKRSLYEQILNLSPAQKQAVFARLQENYLPQNRAYKYDFFFDNCATRIGDIFKAALEDSLVFGDRHVRKKQSFRDLIDIYLVKAPWADYGIDILLGLPTDDIASSRQYMFLPDYVDSVFQHSVIIKNGEREDFVASRSVILDMRAEADFAPPAFQPYVLNLAIFFIVAVITIAGYRKKRRFALVDQVLFNVVGLVGWLIVFLWFFTDHIATKGNLNLLWAWPVFFPLFFFIFNDKIKILRKYVFVLFTIVAVGVLVFWNGWPQNLHNALVWMVLTLALRSIYNLIFDIKLKNH